MTEESVNAKEVFRRSTMNRVTSSDELDHYIKVTNPSAWAVTLAALLLICGIITWSVIAIVPVTVETIGVTVPNDDPNKVTVLCWVDETTADRINESGMKASVDGIEAEDAMLGETPMSFFEVVSFLDIDYFAEKVQLENWNYLVSIELDTDPTHTDYAVETSMGEGHLVPVSIVVSETRPINIVLGKNS